MLFCSSPFKQAIFTVITFFFSSFQLQTRAKMKIQLILPLLILQITQIKCDGTNVDLIMNMLSQFVSQTTTTNAQATSSSSGILPKVLNPMNWIPKFPDIPWNPDAELTTPEIIARHGYPAETHTVKTEDGYLLNMHRIPCGKNGCGDGYRQPVFLQHGILASSSDWILSGPEKGIGFLLADMGYDVWLSNLRGNTYSRHHVELSNSDKEFWDFSFHEMAIYDLPAEIDFVYEHREREWN
jgi:lysosomal acid lipase/cholesteryl ester hydrolase